MALAGDGTGAGRFTIASLREMTGLANGTLNKYAKEARVRTAGIGANATTDSLPKQVRLILKNVTEKLNRKTDTRPLQKGP